MRSRTVLIAMRVSHVSKADSPLKSASARNAFTKTSCATQSASAGSRSSVKTKRVIRFWYVRTKYSKASTSPATTRARISSSTRSFSARVRASSSRRGSSVTLMPPSAPCGKLRTFAIACPATGDWTLRNPQPVYQG